MKFCTKLINYKRRHESAIAPKTCKATKFHRVCSEQFQYGKKMYMNNVPTIFLKTLTPKPVMNRTSRNRLGSVPKNNEVESIIASPTTY